MRIACLGGGPGGLYFAISMKLRDPEAEVVLFERNQPDDTFGWGVVLSDQTLNNLAANDPVSADVIRDHFAYWDDLAITIRGERVVSGGHGFCGIGRRRLLLILQERARNLGVNLQFSTEVDVEELKQAFDVVVACDGLNSKTRERYADVFQPMVDTRACKFVWLGTTQTFDDAFTFIFEEAKHGWIWVHAYQFDDSTATFIVECSQQTFDAFGFGEMSQQGSIDVLQEVFKDHLGGHPLMTNAHHIRGSAWINFPRVMCERWSHENVVLMGDAAATAHFSIGSGTKLALESAISLADLIHREASLGDAFGKYESDRRGQVLRIQSAALNSLEWFENIHRYLDFAPVQLNYAQLTRSQRIGHENLRLRDPDWLEAAEHWYQSQAGAPNDAPARPPVEAPIVIGGLRLPGRVVVENCGTDDQTAHLGPGIGLVMSVPRDLAKPNTAWTALEATSVPVAARLSHAGPRSRIPVAAAPVPWRDGDPLPMAAPKPEDITAMFGRAAKEAAVKGFAVLELDMAGGGLLGSYLSPLTNPGVDLADRMSVPLAVLRAVRTAWSGPLFVRWTADDALGKMGLNPDDSLAIAHAFDVAGADIQTPVTGGTLAVSAPQRGRMWGVPASDRIRNEAHISTLAIGGITEQDHANAMLLAGRADLIGVSSRDLASPAWAGEALLARISA